jgi:hypothetical protein
MTERITTDELLRNFIAATAVIVVIMVGALLWQLLLV